MKKNLFKLFVLIISAFIASNIKAQITLTQADMPTAGTIVIEGIDTSGAFSVGNSGTGQTWNFAALQNHETDTMNFVSPNSTQGGTYFPSSNLALGLDGDIYITVDSSGVFFDGMYADFGFGYNPMYFTPPQNYLDFPTTYNSGNSGSSSFTTQMEYSDSLQPQIDSIRSKHTTIYSWLADASGTLTAPTGTFNVLRIIRIESGIDSSWARVSGNWMLTGSSSEPADTSYQFWANGQDFSVVEWESDNYVSYLINISSGLENIVFDNSINVYPNPVKEKIYISGVAEISMLMIFDETGKLAENALLKNSNSALNISKYENGIYLYKIVNTNGENLSTGKFVKN